MAYNRKALSGCVGVGAKTPSLYTYKTVDTKANIIGAGYFNGSADIFEVNDLIVAEASDGMVIARVSANTGAAVTAVAAYTEV